MNLFPDLLSANKIRSSVSHGKYWKNKTKNTFKINTSGPLMIVGLNNTYTGFKALQTIRAHFFLK